MGFNKLKFSKPPSKLLREYLQQHLLRFPDYYAAEYYVLLGCPLRFLLRLRYGLHGELTWTASTPRKQNAWVLEDDGLSYLGSAAGEVVLRRLSRIRVILWQTEQITLTGRWAFERDFSELRYVDILPDTCLLRHWDNSQGFWDFASRQIYWSNIYEVRDATQCD